MVRMLGTNRYATGAAAVAIAAATVVGAAGSALGAPPAGRAGSPGRTAGHLDPGLATSGNAGVRVVVSARPGRLPAAEHAARAVHGTVGKALPLVDGFAATVPADRLRALAAEPSVNAVTADRSAKLDDRGFDAMRT